MVMMSNGCHSFRIKSQANRQESSSTSSDADMMNLDIDNESISYSQPYDPFSSPQKPPIIDTVGWANSQPVALKSLLSEATKKARKSPLRQESTWLVSDEANPQAISTSRGGRSRPLRRTNSSARARLGPEAASTTSNPPPGPDEAFWGKDRLTVLTACQNVSERMNENVFSLSAQANDTKVPLNRKHHPTGIFKPPRRTSAPLSAGHERDGVRRLDKGKQRANLGASFQRSFSAPLAAPPSSVTSSSSSGGSSSGASATVSPDTSMMEIDPPDTIAPIAILETPPPPLFKQPAPPLTRTSSATSTSSADTSILSATPEVKLHPLLTQKQPPKPKNLPHAPHVPTKHTINLSRRPSPNPALPLNPLVPPSLSQSTRPPPLGMRRSHTIPNTSAHPLQSRQKGFKPPLLSQPNPTSKPKPCPAPHAPDAEAKLHSRKVESLRSPSPDMNFEADSSFGDVSLGINDDMLELTMRQYD